jgi:hypothetical protein
MAISCAVVPARTDSSTFTTARRFSRLELFQLEASAHFGCFDLKRKQRSDPKWDTRPGVKGKRRCRHESLLPRSVLARS